MLKPRQAVNRKSKSFKRGGAGLINTLINKLPVELHIPAGFNKTYSYCGPGTKLHERLKKGDRGINKLDEYCKNHDIAYDQNTDLKSRHHADRILQSHALERFRASDATLGEKAAALAVSAVMKAKTKLGMGAKSSLRRTRKDKKPTIRRGGALSLNSAANLARKALKNIRDPSMNNAIKIAVNAIKKSKKKRNKMKLPRVIPIPKQGGVLPLIPIFAGLSALGALTGGAASIARAVNSAKEASENLKEAQRHNQTMESIAMGKGLYLRPYKSGLGLFLAPHGWKKNYP